MGGPRPCCEHRVNGLKKYLIGVGISLTTALACQSMALLWWAGAISTRVERVEKDVDGLTTRVHTIETSRAALRP
jgi:hypothetical protein